jgi:quinol monooxygenase YgiN
MSVYVVIDMQVKPEALEQVKAGLKAALPDTRAYDGCQGVDCYANTEDPNNLIGIDVWESQQHYEKYSAWREETGFTEQMTAALSAPPSIRHYERMDV